MATPQHRTGDPVRDALAFAMEVLPDQGPIGVFIHHNTLHSFQHLPFHEGVQKGAELLGARPYPPLEFFRRAYREGRLTRADLDFEVRSFFGERAGARLFSAKCALDWTLGDLFRFLCLESLDQTEEQDLKFLKQEDPKVLLPDSEWMKAAESRVNLLPPPRQKRLPARRYRDLVFSAFGVDLDTDVHSELIRLAGVFLDQGLSRVKMPGRERGFFVASGALLRGAAGGSFFRGIAEDFSRWARTPLDSYAIIQECLTDLGVPFGEQEDYLIQTLLALPGWAGMFSRLERHADEGEAGVPVRLIDFLGIRLALERRALKNFAHSRSLELDWLRWKEKYPTREEERIEAGTVLLAGIAQAGNLSPLEVRDLAQEDLSLLWKCWDEFTPIFRGQILLQAYERFYRRQTLDALSARWRLGKHAEVSNPHSQYVFCIDEREESLRRAIEELRPEAETFGTAGFFGLAVDFQGFEESHSAPYCPAVVTPAHEVREVPLDSEKGKAQTRRSRIQSWNQLMKQTGRWSRSAVGGAGASMVLGPLAGPLATLRVLSPRVSLKKIQELETWWAPKPQTQLSSLRSEDSMPQDSRKPMGFTIEEAAHRVGAQLKNIGLTQNFSQIVVFLGHGSTSLNNPHESAHDCGACGGRRGGTNARLFAELANNSAVRSRLLQQGISIGPDVWFVGGLHDTSDDRIECYDLDRIPKTLRARWEEVVETLEAARRENAKERVRRFENAALTVTRDEALTHVQERAAHLGQPRPEYGHCTNSIAVVGRRSLTRGLHLDRRAFLVSYDPEQDADGAIIERVLAAVGPVGAGINLEYYFSSVDNERFGCGTKLPHNITGLMGVMNGHQSDLRTGLPLQMVEIHEPMRLLLIVEARPETLLSVAGKQPEIRELVVQEWVQLVSVHPQTQEMRVWRSGKFEPYLASKVDLPKVRRSADWNQQSREHLTPALIVSQGVTDGS